MENISITQEDQFSLEAIYDEKFDRYAATFTVDKKVVDKICNTEFKRKKKTLNIKGFRRSKLTRPLVEKMTDNILAFYGSAFSIYANANVMKHAPTKVMMITNHVVNKLDDGRWTVKFNLWLEPEIKLPDNLLSDLSFKIKDFDVDHYVDSRIRNFSRLYPYLRSKETDDGQPIPAEEHDMVAISVECTVDGNRVHSLCEENTNIRLIPGSIAPVELYQELVGSVPGKEINITSTNIPKALINELNGKTLVVTGKVLHVYRCEESEIDDDLAITAGFENLEKWKEQLYSQANRYREAHIENSKKQAILDHLVDNIEIPGFGVEWAFQKAHELLQNRQINDINQNTITSIQDMFKHVLVLRAIGEDIEVEWNESDLKKSIYDRNEQAYAQKVMDKLLDMAVFEIEPPEDRTAEGSEDSDSPSV